LAELEFMMPYGHSEPLPDMRSAGGYLWGYIDLVFRHAGRYYVLDWKSNTLPDYAPDSLAESMRAEAYDLQGRLYALALHRWLQGRLPGYQPESHFGGVFYLYLRGMQGDSQSGKTKDSETPPSFVQSETGVAAWRPSRLDLEKEYPQFLSTYLGVPPEALRSGATKPFHVSANPKVNR
jgi:PD-(D/E)XK nuclease superfamily